MPKPMPTARHAFLLAMLFFIGPAAQAQDTLRVMYYNLLNYPSAGDHSRDADLRAILRRYDPDVLWACELVNEAAADQVLDSVLNYNSQRYKQANFVNGPNSDNLLYYKQNKLSLTQQQTIQSWPRNINHYELQYTTTSGASERFGFIGMHLKAGDDKAEEQERNQQAQTLRSYLDSATTGQRLLVGGDLNLKRSSEPAFQTLVDSGSYALADPISRLGDWNANPNFADVHTQSTRTNFQGDGGATGGLDDRFDLILVTPDLLDPADGVRYVAGSYEAAGNDGQHLNERFIAPPLAGALPARLDTALWEASDHLPVVMDVAIKAPAGRAPTASRTGPQLWSYQPGGAAQLRLMGERWHGRRAQLRIIDLQGRVVHAQTLAVQNGRFTQPVRTANFPAGMYVVQVRSGAQLQTRRVMIRE
jgi:endonuclease/exonuclease/phosphatase family metal-dependent hydrolase